jgi:phosphoribosyl-AMP cyclohydrolase
MDDLNFDEKALIPAIVQDDETDQVLMLGYMNKEALEKMFEGPDVWFYNRSRQEMWYKGATSGNYPKVRSVMKDCENNSLPVRAQRWGLPAIPGMSYASTGNIRRSNQARDYLTRFRTQQFLLSLLPVPLCLLPR